MQKAPLKCFQAEQKGNPGSWLIRMIWKGKLREIEGPLERGLKCSNAPITQGLLIPFIQCIAEAARGKINLRGYVIQMLEDVSRCFLWPCFWERRWNMSEASNFHLLLLHVRSLSAFHFDSNMAWEVGARMSESLFEFVTRWILYVPHMHFSCFPRLLLLLWSPYFGVQPWRSRWCPAKCRFFEILAGLCLFLQSRQEWSSAAGTFVHNVSFTANKLAELQLKRAAGINNIATAFLTARYKIHIQRGGARSTRGHMLMITFNRNFASSARTNSAERRGGGYLPCRGGRKCWRASQL